MNDIMTEAQVIEAIGDALATDGLVVSNRIIGKVLEKLYEIDQGIRGEIRQALSQWESSGYSDSDGVLENIGNVVGHTFE